MPEDRLTVPLDINGFTVEAVYRRRDVEEIFMPLLLRLNALHRLLGRRLVALLAAPPGAGKSTLAAFLAQLSGTVPGGTAVQAVGMDGFHYPQAYLETHTAVVGGALTWLSRVKGCPETFDLAGLSRTLAGVVAEEDVAWPVYDRTAHDVAADGVRVYAGIVLVEGNWLLLDEPGWRGLRGLCGYGVFVDAPEGLLQERLVARKVRGGMPVAAAERFYVASDGPNVQRALARRLPADIMLRLGEDGGYSISDGHL